MITRAARVRFAVFLVVAAVGTFVVGSQYVGIDRSLWNRPYTVRLEASHSGGIFQNAEVSYRGTAVGRVDGLGFTEAGVTIELAIDRGVEIPADVKAVIENRSAIGEQFVDLAPTHDGPPWLGDGDVIAASEVSLPPRLEEVLLSVKDLTDSVDTRSLRVLTAELGKGFDGVGPELQSILDDTGELVATLDEAYPATEAVLRDARTVLATQRETAGELSTWSQSLSSLSGSIASSDTKVRRLLDNASSALPAITKFVTDNDQQLPLLMRDMVTVGDIVRARIPGIRVFLVAFPRLVQDTFNVVQGDGNVHFNLVLDYSSGACTSAGYRNTVKSPQAKPVPELGNPGKRADLNGYCAEKPGSITAVRGSQNVPLLPGDTYDPASGQVDNPRRGRLGADRQAPTSYETTGDSVTLPAPTVEPATLNRRTGLVTAAGEPVFVLGESGRKSDRSAITGWQWLVVGPIYNGGYLQ